LVLRVISDPIVAELHEKLTVKCGLPVAEVDLIVGRLKARSEHVPARGRSGWVVQDPDDDKCIDAALTAGASIIVSGDRHLLALDSVDGVEIVSARQLSRSPGSHERER
jgi:predicted nucleic acid-binding protein